MMHTIISLEDIFYTPVQNISPMPEPVSSLNLKNISDDTEFSTDPYIFLNRLYKDKLFI